MFVHKAGFLVLVSALSFSCGPSPERPAAEPGSGDSDSVDGTAYEGVGTIMEINDNSILIDHDAIPGFMEAMSMTYPVSDPALLEPFEQGMVVSFRVVVKGSSYKIDRIEPGARRQGS